MERVPNGLYTKEFREEAVKISGEDKAYVRIFWKEVRYTIVVPEKE